MYHCVFVWAASNFYLIRKLTLCIVCKIPQRTIRVFFCIFYLRLALFSNDRSKSVFDDLRLSCIVSKTSVLRAEKVNEKTSLRHNRISNFNSVNIAIRITAVILSFFLF